MDDVRIHTGPKPAKAGGQINARAFTVGNHVAFNSGEYDPSSPEGQHVLAHELAHVRQQTGGAVSMLPQEELGLEIDPDPQLEREAEETAQRVMQGGELGIQRMAGTEVHVQRLPEDKLFEAIALFEAENESGEASEFREQQNANRLAHLHDVANEAIEKQDKQASLSTKQELQTSNSPGARETAKGFPSEASLKSDIEDLKSSIDADLDDVALTDDQRRLLNGNVEIDTWDKITWATAKKILKSTLAPQLIALATKGPKAVGIDVDKRGQQTFGQLRRGDIKSLDDLKNIWRQTNGTLEERAEQVEQEIRAGTWLEDGNSDYK